MGKHSEEKLNMQKVKIFVWKFVWKPEKEESRPCLGNLENGTLLAEMEK